METKANRINWNTTISNPDDVPDEVIEKLDVLRDFMAYKNGNVSRKFSKIEAQVADELCMAAKESIMALDRAFKKILDKYVFTT